MAILEAKIRDLELQPPTPAPPGGEWESLRQSLEILGPDSFIGLRYAQGLMGAPQALQEARRLGAQLPYHRGTLIAISQLFLEAGEVEEAGDQLRRVLRLYPDDMIARLCLARILIKQGRLREADSLYRRTGRPNAHDPQLMCKQGDYLEERGKAEAAVAMYLQAISLVPEQEAFYVKLLNLYHSSGNAPEAVATFGRLANDLPDEYLPHLYLGMALRTKGDLTGALAEYQKAMALNPSDPRTRNNLVNLSETIVHQGEDLVRENKPEEALALFQQVWLAGYQTEAVATRMVDTLENLGRLAEAEAVCIEALDASAVMVKRLESLFTKRGDASGYLAQLEELAQRHSDNVALVCWLGRVREATGDLKGAVNCYQEVLERDPQNTEAADRLAGALVNANETPGAVDATSPPPPSTPPPPRSDSQ